MTLEKAPFQRYHEEKKIDSFTVRLNAEERATLEMAKKVLKQPKDSTALKQLAKLGAKVIHDQKIKEMVDIITNNERKNERLGIVEYD